jgi:hypothetical protein
MAQPFRLLEETPYNLQLEFRHQPPRPTASLTPAQSPTRADTLPLPPQKIN